ncbi:hypothetical protein EG68_07877 [Paragonimus skrjabini miyazakii]|uniref:CUB domain-containing protein n=1 Tax=Paragonimus skrjabini miyazakii TaxID=59628 RepID=A0A8S9YQB5_9TREM|nr:hypothetical protein EG68_07877 [Paragonimus skrjabini miyazakii]
MNSITYLQALTSFIVIVHLRNVMCCNETFVGQESGNFTSLRYPSVYPSLMMCNWEITVAQGKRISLLFDVVNIEEYADPLNDFVAVFDGPGCASSVVGLFAGYERKQFLSTSNSISVMFNTDNSHTSHVGFSAKYVAVSQEEPVTDFKFGSWLAATSNNQINICGGRYTDPDGHIEQASSLRTMCMWVIEANPFETIHLDVKNIEMGSGGWYAIYDGYSCMPNTKHSRRRTVHNGTESVQSSTNNLIMLTFRATFNATYKTNLKQWDESSNSSLMCQDPNEWLD